MTILVCYGTRPEYIKLAPLLREFQARDIRFKTLFIKQHTSLLEGWHQPDHAVDVSQGGNRLDKLLGALANVSEMPFRGADHVLVQGDTATALGCGLAAFNRSIPVIHLEAGLRTYDKDNPYPEEVYRQLISRVASFHLCPTTHNYDNLRYERVGGEKRVVGNTVLDTLVHLRGNTSLGDEVLITLHRRENHPIMHEWFAELDKLAEAYPQFVFTLPLHPNPEVQKHKKLLTHVKVVEPMGHGKFAERMAECALLITDSGGIQEESAFLGKRCVVCRKVTERPESLGITGFMCKSPDKLREMFAYALSKAAVPTEVYGDGTAAQKVCDCLKGWKIC